MEILVTGATGLIGRPLVQVLLDAGAGTAQTISFLTSWSIFAVHQLLAYELPLMGWSFTGVRLAASAILPLIAGFLAYVLTTS